MIKDMSSVVLCFVTRLALQVGQQRFREKLISTCNSTRRHNPEDNVRHIHSLEYLKYRSVATAECDVKEAMGLRVLRKETGVTERSGNQISRGDSRNECVRACVIVKSLFTLRPNISLSFISLCKDIRSKMFCSYRLYYMIQNFCLVGRS